MYCLSLPREQCLREYRALPNLDGERKTSYLYAKAINHFHIGGSYPGASLVRNAETLNLKSTRPIPVPDR
jgi:hypothetical protein